MSRFVVTYIRRSGGFAHYTVFARSKKEARKLAEQRGYEDIKRVRRVGFPAGAVVVTVLILGLVVWLVCQG